MKKKILAALAAVAAVACIFSGCQEASVSSIKKTSSNGLEDTYTITYSNGKTDTLTIANGKDGAVSIDEAYQTYKSIYGDNLSYDEFLQKYLTYDGDGFAKSVNASLLSSLKVVSEFQMYSVSGGGAWGRPTYSLTPAIQQGSAVIYKIEDDYTYAITNYHVIYNDSAQGDKESKKTFAYIYGSEQTPYLDNSSSQYVYGDSAIACEYIGGEISYDIALLKMSTSELKKRNSDICAVEVETRYNVGDAVYSVGNTEGLGIAVNSGVVSVDSEYITLKIDSQSRSYRSIRMDAAIHEGNSGGGLFNASGKLIGINNAGSTQTTSMNYAIPASIVKSVADNILYYYNGSAVGAKKLVLGVVLEGANSRFAYDKASGYGKIKEDILISQITENSIASTMGLAVGDVITAITINGTQTQLNRFYEIGDLLLTVRAGDSVKLTCKRGDVEIEVEHTVADGDLQDV